MDIIFSLFNNNIGVVLVFISLIVSILIIGKSNFFFKDNNSLMSARVINELRDRLDDLYILIKGSDELVGLSEKVEKIKSEIKSIHSTDLSEDTRNKIEVAISKISEESLNKRISDSELIRSSVKKTFDNMIKSEVLNAIESKGIIRSLSSELEKSINLNAQKGYDELLEKEYSNSLKLKAVLVNLFVFVNMSMLILVILLTYGIISRSAQGTDFSFPTQLALTMSGLYVSFAAFVIYVIKFANSRTLTILALREDWSKQSILLNVIDIIKSKENLNENDVAIIRTIMTNRTQREQKTSHPYEILLQGISGSNIQFKGGKVQVGRDRDN
ncbi:hypothetical protein [Dickeya dianthicola]|uniref:hypothetical protein n=1 Tax=Dickeya dianthicola TaxID=204039 RepID=UPI0030187514